MFSHLSVSQRALRLWGREWKGRYDETPTEHQLRQTYWGALLVFFIAAVTNCHNFSDLKQETSTLLQF